MISVMLPAPSHRILGAVLRAGLGIALLALPGACSQDAAGLRPLLTEQAIRDQAAKASPLRWKVPLGNSLIEEMRPLEPNRILVGLRLDDEYLPNRQLLMIDTGTGAVIWKQERTDQSGEYTLVHTSPAQIVFRVTGEDGTALLALDSASGLERWKTPLPGGVSGVRLLPGTNLILATGTIEGQGKVLAVEIDSGKIQWEYTEALDPADSMHPPMATSAAVWVFYSGVTALKPDSGQPAWSRKDIRLGPRSPPVVATDTELILIDSRNRLLRVDPSSGRTLRESKLEAGLRYTNIYPYGERLYLRAEDPKAGGVGRGRKANLLVALNAADDRALWTYRDAEPSISNLIEHDGRVYVATQSRLLSLDLRTGQRYFSRQVTNSGRTYPVHLRRFDDTFVFIGELIIAGVESKRGKSVYTQTMDSLDTSTSLTSLDAAIRANEKLVAQQDVAGDVLDLLAIYSSEARDFQNLSNSYHQFQSGDYIGAASSLKQAREPSRPSIDLSRLGNSFSDPQYALDLTSIVTSTVAKLTQMLEEKKRRIGLARQKFFRRSILAAYAQAETQEYVFRPHQDYQTKFAGVSVVRLRDGKRTDAYLSPKYLTFGLWNLVDFEHGVVYHHGIGLDPKAHVFGDLLLQESGLIRIYGSFLIAREMPLPN